jgi:serine protease inhibitor
MKQRAGILMAVLLGLVGVGWMQTFASPSTSIAQSPPLNDNELETMISPLVDAQTTFGFKLFSQLTQQAAGQNVVISPMSVAIALSMVYNGAAGDTKQAIAETLALQGMSLEQLNQSSAALEEALENADPDVKLAIANSLWARQGIEFKPDFLQRNQEFYNAEIAALDFVDAAARINAWVNEQTEGKISQIVDQVSPDDVLFLVNAIYFKGQWSEEFDPALTRDRPFNRPSGDATAHPLMEQTADFRYAETEQFQAISLPYGQGRLTMEVVLPKPNVALSTVVQTLTSNNAAIAYRQRPGTVRLPKFSAEYGEDLQDALTAMEMGIAFNTQRADFSALADQSMVISQVKHKAVIEVNEAGTEAAAATSIGVMVTSMPMPQEPFEMTVDRPFFFVIRDRQTNAILFMGQITNPEV